jgi:hypothetical protein
LIRVGRRPATAIRRLVADGKTDLDAPVRRYFPDFRLSDEDAAAAVTMTAPGPGGVAVRDRLRLSQADAAVLAEVGVFLGSPASGDLAVRSRRGRRMLAASWAMRKRELTGKSSARWAGGITKATHDQWSLARRGQTAHLAWPRGQIASIEARPARPLGAKATAAAWGRRPA